MVPMPRMGVTRKDDSVLVRLAFPIDHMRTTAQNLQDAVQHLTEETSMRLCQIASIDLPLPATPRHLLDDYQANLRAALNDVLAVQQQLSEWLRDTADQAAATDAADAQAFHAPSH